MLAYNIYVGQQDTGRWKINATRVYNIGLVFLIETVRGYYYMYYTILYYYFDMAAEHVKCFYYVVHMDKIYEF